MKNFNPPYYNSHPFLKLERGFKFKRGGFKIGLIYPSSYKVGMSSLGFLTVYRMMMEIPSVSVERFFLDIKKNNRYVSLECASSIQEFNIVAISIATEMELVYAMNILFQSGIPPLRKDRSETAPLIIVGGPITYVDPDIPYHMADIIVYGESEQILKELIERVISFNKKEKIYEELSQLPGIYIPEVMKEPPKLLIAPITTLPAYSSIVTPKAEFSNMFLIEAVRGCPRNCAFCIMAHKRWGKGSFRVIPLDKIFSLIPSWVKKVGFVGAGVSDHPNFLEILERSISMNKIIGVSSLRINRLQKEILKLLKRCGYRTLTTAIDAFSQRLRDIIRKEITERDIIEGIKNAKTVGYDKIKLYSIIGYPMENWGDIEEGLRLIKELAKIIKITLSIAPFVSKPKTELENSPFADFEYLNSTIAMLKKELTRSKVTLKIYNPEYAFIEYTLSNAKKDASIIAYEAILKGFSTDSLLKSCLNSYSKS